VSVIGGIDLDVVIGRKPALMRCAKREHSS
jgi:hypothetical protein